MLKHCVFLNFKSNVTKSKQFELFKSLSSLKNKIDGIVDFDYGNNLDFEKIEYYQENIIEACSVKHSDWLKLINFQLGTN